MATATAPKSKAGRAPTLAIAQPPYHSYEDADGFVVYEDVPVWCEHFSKQADQHFGPDELTRVVERCNARIDDTDDYSPIVIRHTKDEGDSDPPVVGLAGPFKLGTIGKKNPKAAILARMRFFKGDAERVKRYPRVSVEYWFSKKDPTNGFFDPISILGADTPELDLGLRYSKAAHGDKNGLYVTRYSALAFGELSRADYAAAANPGGGGGSNTFMPGTGVGKGKASKKPKANANDDPGDDGIDADECTEHGCTDDDPAQYEREGSGEGKSSGGSAGLNGVPMNAAALAQFVEAVRPVIREIITQEMPTPQPPQIAEPAPPVGMNSKSNMSADDPGSAGAEPFPPSGSAPAGNETPGGMDEGQDAPAGLKSNPKSPSKGNNPMADDANKDKARNSAAAGGGDDTAVARYQKQVNDLTTERDELKAKYEKATREVTDTKAELVEVKSRIDAIEAEGRKNARYAKLIKLRDEGYTTLTDEFVDEKLAKYAKRDDEMFEELLSDIRMNHSRVPIGRGLPMARATHEGPDGKQVSPEERERFAKEAAGEVAKARSEGKSLVYGDALKAVYAKAKKEIPA